ncbi:sensor histidine kinase [Limimonas halophila]|uniref:sensor histidine kinase n=1 Tax=Limimonas halophila TaxID=1082479 RepID=UPI0015A13A49|nr:PAS domain-containing sensor histidine kinase [Limimonas halophila]
MTIEILLLVPSYYNNRAELLEQVETEGLAYIRAAKQIPQDSRTSFTDKLERATENSRWMGAAVLAPDGRVLAHQGVPPRLAHRCPEMGAGGVTRDDMRVYEVCWPAETTGLPYAVAARFDSSDAAAKLSAYVLRVGGLVAVVTLGTTGVLLFFVGRRVLLPVLHLRRRLMTVAERPESAPRTQLPSAPARDEIADLVDASGRMLDHVADTLDDLHRRNAALRDSEARFRQIFERSYDGIFLVDVPGDRIVDANPAACAMLGYSEDEITTVRPSAVHPDEMAALSAFYRQVSTRGWAQASGMSCLRPDGSKVPVDIAGAQIDWQGETLMLAVVHDMREHKRLEQALNAAKERAEQADRMKSQFLAAMSHELRTPLNAIIGFSEIMANESLGELGNDRYRDYANDILGAGRHLHDIINDILDISKIEAGQMHVEADALDVRDTVRRTLRLLERRARAANVFLESDVPADLPAIHADERHTRQILTNLVSNAVKFAPAGTVVRVAAETRPGDTVRLSVSDGGPGMDADEVATALEPFQQVRSNAHLADHGGTGLGLPLSKRLAELNGGTLTVDSTAGVGTTVHVDLPPATAGAETAAG